MDGIDGVAGGCGGNSNIITIAIAIEIIDHHRRWSEQACVCLPVRLSVEQLLTAARCVSVRQTIELSFAPSIRQTIELTFAPAIRQTSTNNSADAVYVSVRRTFVNVPT